MNKLFEKLLEMIFSAVRSKLESIKKEPIKVEMPKPKPEPKPLVDRDIHWEPSPNFSSRKGEKIKAIILHHTGPGGLKATISWAKTKESKISYHYVIDVDGDIYQLVKDEHKAWHAGVAMLHGSPKVNGMSIGVALVGKGDKPFSEDQYKALIYLCKKLKRQYDIDDSYIACHKDVAPARKIDPAPFDLKHFLQRLNKE